MKHPIRALLFFVVVFTLTLGPSACERNDREPVIPPPAVVEVAHPIRREVVDYQLFTARTEAVQSVDLKPRVTGYLTKINFKDGDEVKQDQVLFEIDDRPYKADLDQATANVEAQKASLLKAQAVLDISLNVRKENPGAISELEIDRNQGARDEAAGSLKAAIAQEAAAKLNYDWCKVTAPISGRLDRHFVDVGNLVSQNVTTLTNIVSLKPIYAYFDVDANTAENYAALLKQGKVPSVRENQIPVQMALGDRKDFEFDGVIDFLANQFDPNTGSVRLRAVFPNEDATLLAGLFGRVRVPVSPKHEALLVSERAIGTDQGQKFILVVNDRNEVERRMVDVGQLHSGLREVIPTRPVWESGPTGQEQTKPVQVLAPSERVIVNGLQRVRPGATVNPRLVDMQTLLAATNAGRETQK